MVLRIELYLQLFFYKFMKDITLRIEGMSCGHCKNSVERMLKEKEGVLKVEVNLNDSLANVSINSDIVTKEDLVEVINNSGMYKAA